MKFSVYSPSSSSSLTLVSIAVMPSTVETMVTGVVSFTATGTYNDSSTADITSTTTWSSSDTDVATISSGIASSVGYGLTTITATLDAISGTAELTVELPIALAI